MKDGDTTIAGTGTIETRENGPYLQVVIEVEGMKLVVGAMLVRVARHRPDIYEKWKGAMIDSAFYAMEEQGMIVDSVTDISERGNGARNN